MSYTVVDQDNIFSRGMDGERLSVAEQAVFNTPAIDTGRLSLAGFDAVDTMVSPPAGSFVANIERDVQQSYGAQFGAMLDSPSLSGYWGVAAAQPNAASGMVDGMAASVADAGISMFGALAGSSPKPPAAEEGISGISKLSQAFGSSSAKPTEDLINRYAARRGNHNNLS